MLHFKNFIKAAGSVCAVEKGLAAYHQTAKLP